MRKLATEELNRVDVATFQQQPKHLVVLVLDNLRSMHNVGAAFRTADAFNVQSIALCGITARPPHRDIQKTALGATESVSWQHYEEVATCLKQLKDKGFRIVVVEQTDNAISLPAFLPKSDQPLAFVFGNEAFGVSEEALPLADLALEIPQFGTKHSLNVSVSIGVILWDYLAKVVPAPKF